MPSELLERIYHETQGHPCLLQKICREIVTIANKTGRVLLMTNGGVVNIFWNQFCENRGLKETVRQILRGEATSDERALLVLEDHGFILREDGKWRMRVPLFEQWVRRYQVM